MPPLRRNPFELVPPAGAAALAELGFTGGTVPALPYPGSSEDTVTVPANYFEEGRLPRVCMLPETSSNVA